MEKKFTLPGPHLWTRERAREIRGQVESLLQTLASGDVLIMDCSDVEVFDYSFANELFGKLVISLPKDYQGRFLVVEGLTTYTRENLAKALESLNLAMLERKGRKREILGKIHPVDRETYDAVVKAKGSVTSAVLTNKLGINVNAMNERLTKLVGLALVRREKGVSSAGREQFEYSAVV